ncbi:hypothetical protein B0O40_0674 [Ruminococcaceae bacterium R-25]|nr:hypothetical protein B0O40_0674 [Ruminococcaceae bacterium R-25]SUQ11303.1 hypothetical protein SAMN06297423_0674 [Oscillospiraceae bacterium]
MDFESYWILDENLQSEYTDNIFSIMNLQCKSLYEKTNGKVFAIFGEIRTDGTLIQMAKNISEVMKVINRKPISGEVIDGISAYERVDVSSMYATKKYGFEVCTETYRFRLFALNISPTYPLEIEIDEEICNSIRDDISGFVLPSNNNNIFKISGDDCFCEVIKRVIQDTKVKYILNELLKKASLEQKNNSKTPEKIVICEGRTDEIILQAIADKLGKRLTTVVADGKMQLPIVFEHIRKNNKKTKVLILADSDGDEEKTQVALEEKIGNNDMYELAIVNNTLEDWFGDEIKGYSKLKTMQVIDSLVDELDFEKLKANHRSFEAFYEYICH